MQEVKIKARWARASDPDDGRRLLVRDGKSEGVWPLEPVPKRFIAQAYLPDEGVVVGTVPDFTG